MTKMIDNETPNHKLIVEFAFLERLKLEQI